MTRREVLAEIEASERAGIFDNHIDPIPNEIVLPVDERYHYPNQWTAAERLRYGLENFFLVRPFTVYAAKHQLKARYVGRENLRGLKAAVLTCNHITKFDCLVAKLGAIGHKTWVMAAPFNNMNCFLGEMMRAGGMLPLNTTAHGMMNFNRMVEEVLVKRQQFLLIYPEASMWWNYKKPRPYKNGAFGIAVKYNVPVVPQFITLAPGKKTDAEGLNCPELTLHILPPLYPKAELNRKENICYLRQAAFEACKQVYEETYGIPLQYTCEEAAQSALAAEKACPAAQV